MHALFMLSNYVRLRIGKLFSGDVEQLGGLIGGENLNQWLTDQSYHFQTVRPSVTDNSL